MMETAPGPALEVVQPHVVRVNSRPRFHGLDQVRRNLRAQLKPRSCTNSLQLLAGAPGDRGGCLGGREAACARLIDQFQGEHELTGAGAARNPARRRRRVVVRSSNQCRGRYSRKESGRKPSRLRWCSATAIWQFSLRLESGAVLTLHAYGVPSVLDESELIEHEQAVCFELCSQELEIVPLEFLSRPTDFG